MLFKSRERDARRNLDECRVPDQWVEYFGLAEPDIDPQWDKLIWPKIATFDFSVTMELAPGAGRNSAKLLPLTERLDLVDLNQYAIDRCRERFSKHPLRDRIRYHVNDGRSLDPIATDSVTAIYSWDSAVHMDRAIVRDYLFEFARVLRNGGQVFFHHSNYGAAGDGKDIKANPHWRSNVSAERIRKDAAKAQLEVAEQHVIDWSKNESGKQLDCISIFRKP